VTIGTAFVGAVGATAGAAALHVPGDFATIQACIDAAVSGVDECVVAPGTYHETINFLGKGITLRSSGGRDVTTIDATGLGGSVVTCRSGEGPDTVLDGFTIMGGLGRPLGSRVKAGGGIYNYNSAPTVGNCAVRGNTGTIGSGMFNWASSPAVSNCLFHGNTATNYGGGMYNTGSSPTVVNCTFAGNTAGDSAGGMYNYYNSNPTVANCILWDDVPYEIANYVSASTICFSVVKGGLPVGAVDGGGNIDLDPMFVRLPNPGPDGTWDGVDDDYGDLRLQAGSPCIDAGDPGFVVQPGETDLEGHARVLCGRVDMGAYEFGIGDYDCDQVVDLADFSSWQACMTGPLDSAAFHSTIDIRQSTIGCESFDFDGDGSVSLLDFSGFQRVFAP
jgi:hypothetical protein